MINVTFDKIIIYQKTIQIKFDLANYPIYKYLDLSSTFTLADEKRIEKYE